MFVGLRTKWPAALGIFLAGSAAYLAANHFPLQPPSALTLTPVDLGVPFLPWTIWIYLSAFLFLPAAYFLCRCVMCMNKHLYSYAAVLTVNALCFALYPTTYPRELYPLPEGTDALTAAAFAFVRGLDSPNNCAPSLHVSISVLVALGFFEDQRRYFPFMSFWALLLVFSTLTTKQHYVVDVATGALLGAAIFVAFHVLLPYRFTDRLRKELEPDGDARESALPSTPTPSRTSPG